MCARPEGDGRGTEKLEGSGIGLGPAGPEAMGYAKEGSESAEGAVNRQCARRLSVGAKLVGGLIALLQWVGSTQIAWPAGPIAQLTFGVVAATILGFHIVNTHTRIGLHHWECPDLRLFLIYELGLGWCVPLAVLAVVLFLPPTWAVLLALGVAFILTEALYELVEEEICWIVADEGLDQGTDRFGKRQPYKITRSKRTVKDISLWMKRPGPQKFLGFWVKPPWWPGLSRTRTVIAYAMMTCAFIAVTASADVALQHSLHQPRATARSEGASVTKTVHTVAGEAQGGEGDLASGESGTTPGSRKCPHLPSFGAPAWAKNDLEALYYGTKKLNATPPPGNEVGGCTGRAIIPAAQHGTFVYTIGRNELGEIRSLATVSRSFAPSIFLAPSAQRVLELIRDGVAPLGSYPVISVDGGDAIAVNSKAGTYTLVRGAKHMPDSNLAVGYTLLPPTATAAWLGSMKELGVWLWPTAPSTEAGVREYPLRLSRDAESAVKAITYQPADGSARRDQYTYLLPQPRIGEQELKLLARTAR